MIIRDLQACLAAAWLEQSRSPKPVDLRSSNQTTGDGKALSFAATEFADTSSSVPDWFNAAVRSVKANP